MIFLSTGRCGTRRLWEILRAVLPGSYAVVHQVPLARLANVVGNLAFYGLVPEAVPDRLYRRIVRPYMGGTGFVSTDPLTAMIVPREFATAENVCLVHVEREPEAFARSFYRWTRSRPRSFVAHNLVPLWQPGLWPLENALSPRILEKYQAVCRRKNAHFAQRFGGAPNYHRLSVAEVFSGTRLQELVNRFFGLDVVIPPEELEKRSNAS